MIYSPEEDSYLLEKEVKKISKNKKVLDLGSGSGIQALSALKSGAKSVLASDISPEAVKFLKSKSPCRLFGLLDAEKPIGFLLNRESGRFSCARSVPCTKVRGLSNTSTSKNFNVIKSDLFKEIREKFDLIIFNPPYLPEDTLEDSESALITTGGKKGDEIILRFLKQAKSHLNANGIILLLLSSLTPKKRIFSLINSLGFKKKKLSSKKLFMETLYVLKISNKLGLQ